MAPCSIESTALSELIKLATWVHDHAKMEEVAKNTFKCVDKDRRDKLRPFLDAQKYSKIWGHGYAIYRIKGKAEIGLTPNYRSLFFPLSVDPGNNDQRKDDQESNNTGNMDSSSAELQVAGEVLKPGDYIHFTSALVLDAQVDCLIVLLPNTVTK